MRGGEDSFLWHPTFSGIYTTKSGYYSTCKTEVNTIQTTTGEEFSWIRDVWAGSFSPKLKTFLWSILHNAIALGSNLQKRGLVNMSSCPRCQEVETAEHCFFTCPFAKKVWEAVPLATSLHIAAGISIRDYIVKSRRLVCLPPSGVTLNILPWVLWAVWTSRNLLIFEGRCVSPEDTAAKGVKLAK